LKLPGATLSKCLRPPSSVAKTVKSSWGVDLSFSRAKPMTSSIKDSCWSIFIVCLPNTFRDVFAVHRLYLPQGPRANRSLVTSPARTTETPGSSDRDALAFIERDLVAGAILELGGARAFMCRHGLCFSRRAAPGAIGGDAGGSKGMTPDLDAQANRRCAALDHGPGA